MKRADGQGRLAVHEIMINTPTVQKLIEDDKIAALGRAIEDSSSFYKMQSLNQALLRQVKAKTITADEALAASRNPNDLKIQLQTQGLMDSKAEAPVSLPPGSRGA